MPELIFRHVVSSTDSLPGFGAENLLTNTKNDVHRWKGKSGVESNVVVLQLDREERVTALHIGNEGSAFVEVLVARSAEEAPSYASLISSTTFMDPIECRKEENMQSVKLFTQYDLNGSVAKKKWDLFKFVCRQPFNPRIPFGLSFVRAFGADVDSDQVAVAPAHEKPLIAKTLNDDITAGGIRGPLNVIGNLRKRDFQAEFEEAEKKIQHDEKETQQVDQQQKTMMKETKKEKLTKLRQSLNTFAEDNGEPSASSNLDASPKIKKPMISTILKGVKFSLSGFQNPERSQLRDTAISMGAVFQNDVDASLTHLICKFKNTPKSRRVRPNVAVVTSRWLEESLARKKRQAEHLFPVQ